MDRMDAMDESIHHSALDPRSTILTLRQFTVRYSPLNILPAPAILQRFPPWALALIAYAVVALCIARESVLPGRWAWGTDTVAHDLIVHAYAGLHGYPEYAPHLLHGQPLLGSAAVAVYYPPNWPIRLPCAIVNARIGDLPPTQEYLKSVELFQRGGLTFLPWFHALQWPLHWVLAAMGGFVWGGVEGRRPLAAFLQGLIVGFAPHMVSLTFAGHLSKVQAIAWLPWIVASSRAITLHGATPRLLVGASAALAMPMIAGHPQIAYYGGWLWLGVLIAGVTRVSLPQRVWAVLLVGLLAFLMCAATTFAIADFSRQSNRAALSFEETVKSSHPPEESLELIFPRFLGDSACIPGDTEPRTYRGRWGERIVTDYIGLPVILLACIGWRRDRSVRWWALIPALGLLLGMGGYLSVLWMAFVGVVPGLSFFRTPAAIMCLIPIGLAPMAAAGFDALSQDDPLKPSFSFSGMLLYFAALAIPIAIYLPALSLQHIRIGAPIHGGIALSAILGTLFLTRRLRWLCIPVVALDLIVASAPFVRAAPREMWEGLDGMLRDTSQLHRLVEQRDTPRVTIDGVPIPPSIILPGREMTLWPMLCGFRVPLGYHPIAYGALTETIATEGFSSPELCDLLGLDVRGDQPWRRLIPYVINLPYDAGWNGIDAETGDDISLAPLRDFNDLEFAPRGKMTPMLAMVPNHDARPAHVDLHYEPMLPRLGFWLNVAGILAAIAILFLRPRRPAA